MKILLSGLRQLTLDKGLRMRCISIKYVIQNTKTSKTKTVYLRRGSSRQDIKNNIPRSWYNCFSIKSHEDCIGECRCYLYISTGGCSCCGGEPELSVKWTCSNCKNPIPEISLSNIADIENYINTEKYSHEI